MQTKTRMKRRRTPAHWLILFSLLQPGLLLAAPQAWFIESSPVPGGISLVELDAAEAGTASNTPKARWNDRDIAVLNRAGTYVAIIGLPLDTTPGPQTLTVTRNDGSVHRVPFQVEPTHYEEQRIVIKDTRKVNPAPVDMVRINRENKRLKTVKSYRAETMIATTFDWPLAGPVSSPFGLKRFFNDQPRRPHAGIDIAAPEGTPIKAPADGIVIDTGDYFFNGNSVFIEHGLGLQTFFAHMSRIDVAAGERVSQGQVLGAVGKTGRVTGPHLHWSVGLNGTWINPLLLLPTDAPPAKSY